MEDNHIVEQVEKMRAQDQGLQRALKNQPTEPLAHNFCYQTMQKIKEEELRRERRNKEMEIAWLCSVAILGIGAVMIFAGQYLREVWLLLSQSLSFSSVHGNYSTSVIVAVCVLFFGFLNQFLHHQFHK